MTDETGVSTVKNGIGRWTRVALVASLALNLGLIGAGIGLALRRDAHQDRARMIQTRDFGFGPFVGAFEGVDRRALGRDFARSAGEPAQARREVSALFEEMVAVLKNEPFDADAFATLLRNQHQQFVARQEMGADLVVTRIAQMTAEDRAAYAERLDQIVKRPPPVPHGRKNPDAPRQERGSRDIRQHRNPE